MLVLLLRRFECGRAFRASVGCFLQFSIVHDDVHTLDRSHTSLGMRIVHAIILSLTEPTGQQGEDFFLIEEGVVSCTQAKSATDPTEISLLTLGAGEYFGEMALMLEEPRAANCIATGGKVRGGVVSFRFVFSRLGLLLLLMLLLILMPLLGWGS